MDPISTILSLLLVVTLFSLLATRVSIPYPTVMVLGGLVISLTSYFARHNAPLPRLDHIELDPDLVFTLFLPPLLYAAAWQTSWRDFKANLRPITLLAVGLPLFTTAGVAWVAHTFLPGFSWPAAFALGAIISPPDAVAISAITQKLHIPGRIVTILEGESLLNDATALVAYRFAVAAALTGTFSLPAAAAQLLLVSLGGIGLGLALAAAAAFVHAHLDVPHVETILTILTPYAAYISAEHLGLSGVLATVACGLYVSRRSATLFSPALRLATTAVWDFLVFTFNGIVFILIGLQLPNVTARLAPYPWTTLLGGAALISAAAILIRLAWVFAATYVPRLLVPALGRRDPSPGWRAVFLLGFTGMRGVVSLAAAIALPFSTTAHDGLAAQGFPQRDLIIFLAFAIILVTLVLQSLALPPLIALLHLEARTDDHCPRAEARVRAARAGLEVIDEIVGSTDAFGPQALELQLAYQERLRRLTAALAQEAPAANDSMFPGLPASHLDLHREALAAERRTLLGLRDRGQLNDEAFNVLIRDLDLEELRLGGPDPLPPLAHPHGH